MRPQPLLWLTIALIALSGCARISKWRQSARAERTVAAAELGDLPESAAPRSRGNRPSRARRDLSEIAPTAPQWQTAGESVEGRPIEIARLGSGPLRVLVIGGIHGDEPEGLPLIEQLANELAGDRSAGAAASVLVVRDLNPDGTAARTRTNARGVDLNRNFPASNWNAQARAPQFHPGPESGSEPETQVLIELIRDFSPDRILVMHSTRGRPMVNYDGPAREIAEQLSERNRYVTSDSIGYPTPGSLGSYAGKDLAIPIITLELPRGIGTDEAWQANREALHHFVR